MGLREITLGRHHQRVSEHLLLGHFLVFMFFLVLVSWVSCDVDLASRTPPVFYRAPHSHVLGSFLRVLKGKVTKVTEIKIEVGK